MACFLVTLDTGENFCLEEWLAIEKKVIGRLPREIKWVMSWHVPTQQQMLTHWDAPTEQAVRIALDRAGIGERMAVVKIEPAVEVYPKRYVARRNAAHAQKARAGLPKTDATHKRAHHAPREMSGAYAESISSVLQVRAATHLNIERITSN